MKSKSIIIHIGAAKCGSSALQTALSLSPTIDRMDGSQINYAVFNALNGKIVDKDRLTPARNVYGYNVSPKADALISGNLRNLKEEIRKYPTDLIFSRESWFHQPHQWEKILEELDLEVHVVAYVRPKVLVLNSAWWQWGAWSGQQFDRWLDINVKGNLFGKQVRQWSSIKQVSSVTVRPVPSDIVTDFYRHILKASNPNVVIQSNPSLPGPILRLFQRNRSLRPSPHQSGIDFVLSSLIRMEDRTPWILDKNSISRILAETEKDNELLMSFMDERSAQSIRDDPRWWSVSAYEEKIVESPDEQEIPPEKLEEMCVKMAVEIEKLKRENLKRKKSQLG